MSNAWSGLAAPAFELMQRLLGIVPGKDRVNWQRHLAARWVGGVLGGQLVAVETPHAIELDDLLQIDYQKELIVANTQQFVHGLPANNALLWGARGTGKSSLIHALLLRFADSGLRLVEVDKEALVDIAAIVRRVADGDHRFIVVCDDLSFEAEDPSYKALKSALEGSVLAQVDNVLIYATSNRRHLLPETMSDNIAAEHVSGELHEAEAVEEKISLSDRFGLWLSFHPFKQDEYLAVVRHWLDCLGRRHGIEVTWDEALEKSALRWALGRGGRSGRTAHHYARHEIGRRLMERLRSVERPRPVESERLAKSHAPAIDNIETEVHAP